MPDKKIKITFVLPSLVAGGAERILSYVAEHLDTNYFESTLLVTGYKKDTVYQLDNLKIIYLNKPRVLKSFFSLFLYFKKNKPDIVVSSIAHINTLIAFLSVFFAKTKFIGREASVLTEMGKFESAFMFNIKKQIIRFSYQFLDAIVCQSQDMASDLIKNFNVSEKKIEIINNPITRKATIKTFKGIQKPIKLISVSRLSKEKGLERNISILSKLDFQFEFTLIGNGPEKENIFKLINDYNLMTKINYIPFTKEVDKYLAEADIFLQTSYVDGFPNAVVESCSVGTPVIALQAPGGISEIIENGKNGYIVHSIGDFITCLNSINENYSFSAEVVNKVVTDRFNKDLIIKKYEDLFLKVNNL